MRGVVIVRDEADWGVYLGHAMGLGFWTLMDTAGQSTAPVFDSEEPAREHVRSWESDDPRNCDPETYHYAEVSVAVAGYASIAELEAAGLGHLLGDMRENKLRYGEVSGSA